MKMYTVAKLTSQMSQLSNSHS